MRDEPEAEVSTQDLRLKMHWEAEAGWTVLAVVLFMVTAAVKVEA